MYSEFVINDILILAIMILIVIVVIFIVCNITAQFREGFREYMDEAKENKVIEISSVASSESQNLLKQQGYRDDENFKIYLWSPIDNDLKNILSKYNHSKEIFISCGLVKFNDGIIGGYGAIYNQREPDHIELYVAFPESGSEYFDPIVISNYFYTHKDDLACSALIYCFEIDKKSTDSMKDIGPDIKNNIINYMNSKYVFDDDEIFANTLNESTKRSVFKTESQYDKLMKYINEFKDISPVTILERNYDQMLYAYKEDNKFKFNPEIGPKTKKELKQIQCNYENNKTCKKNGWTSPEDLKNNYVTNKDCNDQCTKKLQEYEQSLKKIVDDETKAEIEKITKQFEQDIANNYVSKKEYDELKNKSSCVLL